jgi:hypothetical protein
VVKLKEWMMILQLHRQDLSVSAIAERTGKACKTVRKYIRQELAAPRYRPRPAKPSTVAPFETYLRQRVANWPELTSARLLRKIREQGYYGGKTALYDFLQIVRPPPASVFEVRSWLLARQRLRRTTGRSVKYEEVYLHACETMSAARSGIARDLRFYNSRRRHSALDGSTPDAFYFANLPTLERAA